MRRGIWFMCVLLILLSTPAWATQETCPNSWPWVKRDNLSGKTYTYTPPTGYKVVETCYKASTNVYYNTISTSCESSVTVTTTGQYDISHASFKLTQCSTPTPTPTPPPPTPTPTPTPPPSPTPTPTPTPTPPPDPTPTPTPTPCIEETEPICNDQLCGQTLEWKSGCNTLTKTCEPCECIPITECESWQCGWRPDGCGGQISCDKPCPPPPPPPGRWPTPDCTVCEFPQTMYIENRIAPNEWHAEWFYFLFEKVVYQIVLDTWTNNEYTIYVGKKDPNAQGNIKLFKFTGGRTVTIPIPLAGLPIQQWTHLGFYGGPGRMTIWMRDTNHVSVVQEELTVIVKE